MQHHSQPDGPTIVTTSAPVITVDGLLFKNSSRGGGLLPYEDWRLDADARAADLASRLPIEALAGLCSTAGTKACPPPKAARSRAPTPDASSRTPPSRRTPYRTSSAPCSRTTRSGTCY